MSVNVQFVSGVYVEQDCIVNFDGRSFEANGAFVSPAYVIAYLGQDGVLQDWHGRRLGTYRITSTWPVRCWLSSTMHQVEAQIAGVTYTGRSCGIGMIYRGRRKSVDNSRRAW